MLQTTEATVLVVADDTRTSLNDLDEAFRSQLRLAANLADGLKATPLTARRSQHLLRTAHESLGKVIESRAGMVSLIDQLTVLHRHSNQVEVGAGCPEDIDWVTSAQLDDRAKPETQQA